MMLAQDPPDRDKIEELFDAADQLIKEQLFAPGHRDYARGIAVRLMRNQYDADDAVSDACANLYRRADQLRRNADVLGLAEYVANIEAREYVGRAVQNAALDIIRKSGWLVPIAPGEPELAPAEREPDVSAADTRRGNPMEEAIRLDLAAGRREGLRAIVGALRGRQERIGRTHLTLSSEDITALSQYYRYDGDGGPTLDAIAAELGVSKGQASKRLKRARHMIGTAIYFCRILGSISRTSTGNDIDRHLSEFDKLAERTDPASHSDAKRLLLGGRSIHDHVRTGARASIERFEAAIAEELREEQRRALKRKGSPPRIGAMPGFVFDRDVPALHLAEGRFADSVANPHPACVIVCADHNPEIYRPLEF